MVSLMYSLKRKSNSDIEIRLVMTEAGAKEVKSYKLLVINKS